MTAPHINLSGLAVRSLKLSIGSRGPWVADIEMLEPPAAELASPLTLAIGDTTLRGSLVPTQTGEFALTTSVRMVAGAAGWGKTAPARGYHNDAGVSALNVAQDAASAVGETLGSFAPTTTVLAIDYVRATGPASRALEYAAGDALWWVDFEGVTQVGERSITTPTSDSFQLLSFDVISRVAQLVTDDLETLTIGATLMDDRLTEPQVITDMMLSVSADEPLRITAWCNALTTEPSRLAGLMQTLVRRLVRPQLIGCYRYRVVSVGLSDRRLKLQAVRREAGLPDIQLVSQWPGLPGLDANLTPGSQVLVQFVEGDAGQPVVTGYAGPDGASFVAVSMTLGGSSGPAAARLGDAVSVTMPLAAFSAMIGGSPVTGTITSWTPTTASGTITAGSSKVNIA